AALRPKASGEEPPSADWAVLKEKSVPLGNLAKKTTVEQLAKFLMDPVKVRPSGRMPSLNLNDSEATAIAMYLLRDQAPGITDPSKAQKIQGLTYEYFEGDFGSRAPQYERIKPKGTGFSDGFSLAPRQRDTGFAFRFTGLITIPKEGDYTFYT